MKKYILLCMVALWSLTGCKIDEGGSPGDDRSNRIVTNHVLGAINQMGAVWYGHYTIYTEALLSGEEALCAVLKERWFAGESITLEQDQVRFVSQKYHSYYTLQTQGKLLSEGATWQLSYAGNFDRAKNLATFVGIEGQMRQYRHSYQGEGDDEEHRIDLMVAYEVVGSDYQVVINHRGNGRIEEEDGEYSIDFAIDEEHPLRYEERTHWPSAGELTISYKDHVLGKQHACRVRFEENDIIYIP